MKNRILIFLILIIFLNNVGAIKLSLSPAHIYLSGKTNTDICEKIRISSDAGAVFYGEDKWSLKNEGGNFAGYDLNSEQIGLKVSYSDRLAFDGSDKKEIDFCVNSENAGKFYGVIFFKTSSGLGSIGGLVKVNIFNERVIWGGLPVSLMGFSSALLLVLLLILIFGKRE